MIASRPYKKDNIDYSALGPKMGNLFDAIFEKRPDIIADILMNTNPSDLDLNAKNNGVTALWLACVTNQWSIVELIISHAEKHGLKLKDLDTIFKHKITQTSVSFSLVKWVKMIFFVGYSRLVK